MKKKVVLVVLVISLIFTLSGMTIAADKVFKWRAVTHQMPGTPRYKTVENFCERVKEASNGRLIIEPFGAGVLFPVFDTLDAVKNGMVEMSMIWSGYWSGKNSLFGLLGNIPGSPINDFSEQFYFLEKTSDIVENVYGKFGVVDLGAFDYGTPEILMSVRSIASLDDFKGLNIRTAGISASFYDKLGASTVSLSSPEIYTALQLGTVDAAEYNDWLVNYSMSLQEVTDYVIEPCLHQGSIADKELIVNPRAWDQLPDDLKEIVLMARDEARYKSAVEYDAKSTKNKFEGWIEKAGVKLIKLSQEDVLTAKKIAADLLKEYSQKSEENKQYINAYVETLNELGYYDDVKILKEAGLGK